MNCGGWQDLAVYKYEIDEAGSWVKAATNRVDGRLKLCTRGLVFEPTAGGPRAATLVRWPFKSLTAALRPFALAPGSAAASGVDPGSLFALSAKLCVDVESGGQVAPFVTHDYGGMPRTVVFQLQHSDRAEFLALALELQRIEGQRSAFTDSRGLLRPLLEARLGAATFEMRHLVDFSERLLMADPVRCDRVRPLLRNPGLLMVTDRRVYFQPSQVNNTGAPPCPVHVSWDCFLV